MNRFTLLSMLALLSFGFAADAKELQPDLATALKAAAVGEHRSAENIARNQWRHPVETLVFFGIADGMTVMEITPGGTWYTEILAPALKGRGNYIAAGYDATVVGQPEYRYKQQADMEKLFAARPDLYGEVGMASFSPPEVIKLGAPGSVDMVVTFRNSHGWLKDGVAALAYKSFFEVLKPGGVLGVEQHRTDNPAPVSKENFTGYVSEAELIGVAVAAGFVLEAKSEINANPKDTHDHPEGVWTLPPTLALGDVDKAKYLAIGESDRMTLRFRKPL